MSSDPSPEIAPVSPQPPRPDAPPTRSLLSRLTHALVTPLGSAQISAELLAQDPAGRLGDRERRLVDNVRQATAEVQELLRQAGRLAKAKEGRLHLLVEELAVRDLLVELDRRLGSSADRAAAAVTFGSTAPAARLAADLPALVEVVETLVAALRPPAGAADAPPVRVTVEHGRGTDGRPVAVVAVAGGRPARPPAEADFEPFGDDGGDASGGLELALARALAAAQGGDLRPAPAAAGPGFRLALPLAE